MNTYKLIKGSLEELTTHLKELTNGTEEKMNNTENLLYSKIGIKKQLNEILDQKEKFGIVFLLVAECVGTPTTEINLTLEKFYIHIETDK